MGGGGRGGIFCVDIRGVWTIHRQNMFSLTVSFLGLALLYITSTIYFFNPEILIDSML